MVLKRLEFMKIVECLNKKIVEVGLRISNKLSYKWREIKMAILDFRILLFCI